MKNKLVIAGLALGCSIALAQSSAATAGTDTTQAATTNNTNPQSWVGLLVAMGCDTSSVSGTSNVSMNGNSAMTAPDMNGSRGSGMNGTSNDMTGSSQTTVNQSSASNQNFPKSTASAASESSASMNAATTTDTNNNNARNGMARAKEVASQMGPSCHIGSTTAAFALRLPDGRLIPFDDASNAKIADQIQNRVSGNQTKIFRVVVTGTSDGNTITMNSMRI